MMQKLDNASWYQWAKRAHPKAVSCATMLTQTGEPDHKRYGGPGTLRHVPDNKRTRRYNGKGTENG